MIPASRIRRKEWRVEIAVAIGLQLLVIVASGCGGDSKQTDASTDSTKQAEPDKKQSSLAVENSPKAGRSTPGNESEVSKQKSSPPTRKEAINEFVASAKSNGWSEKAISEASKATMRPGTRLRNFEKNGRECQIRITPVPRERMKVGLAGMKKEMSKNSSTTLTDTLPDNWPEDVKIPSGMQIFAVTAADVGDGKVLLAAQLNSDTLIGSVAYSDKDAK